MASVSLMIFVILQRRFAPCACSWDAPSFIHFEQYERPSKFAKAQLGLQLATLERVSNAGGTATTQVAQGTVQYALSGTTQVCQSSKLANISLYLQDCALRQTSQPCAQGSGIHQFTCPTTTIRHCLNTRWYALELPCLLFPF